MFQRNKADLFTRCLLFSSLIGFAMVLSHAQAAPTSLTQRDINVMAAGVENARSALIDNAGLRHPGEDLNIYLRRIALPLQGETPTHYKTRIGRYLNLLARSVEATQPGQRLPALRDTDAPNRALWQRTVHALQLFPARVAHTKAAWEQAQRMVSQRAKPHAKTVPVASNSFASELAQTVSLLIAIDDNLRDARP